MKLTLWTILNENGWKELQSSSVLRCPTHLIDTDFKMAYDWMKKQMYERMDMPDSSDQYPLWAWYQFKKTNKKSPDLRESGYLPSETIGYRVKFEKASQQVLLSDFELWHSVLNKSYIPASMKDYDLFHAKHKNISTHLNFNEYSSSIKDEIQASWGKIFNMRFQATDISVPFESKSIQATFWELKTDEVLKVDRFIAR